MIGIFDGIFFALAEESQFGINIKLSAIKISCEVRKNLQRSCEWRIFEAAFANSILTNHSH